MQPKLSRKILNQILRCYAAGMPWKETAKFIGVHRNTLLDWRKDSKTAKSGLLKELRLGIQAIQREIVIKANETVISAATENRTTIQQKEVIDRHGEIHELLTTTTEGPDANLALRVLERLQPDRWKDETTRDTNKKDHQEGSAENESSSDSEREVIALLEDDEESEDAGST